MEIKLFSKWRPSPILNLRKLQFWSRVLYWHVIMYFQSKFRINRSKMTQIYIAKKTTFNMNLQNFEFSLKVHHDN